MLSRLYFLLIARLIVASISLLYTILTHSAVKLLKMNKFYPMDASPFECTDSSIEKERGDCNKIALNGVLGG